MYCDPDTCPNCQYIGEGDSYCDEIQRIVLADWSPTRHFMGDGCPYIEKDGSKADGFIRAVFRADNQKGWANKRRLRSVLPPTRRSKDGKEQS